MSSSETTIGYVAVHTGAGNTVDVTKYKAVSRRACKRAVEVLKSGVGVLEACCQAISELEDSGETNAGFGSNLTWDGTVESEASIMDGSSRLFGACTNVTRVRNPIRLAKVICERQSEQLRLGRIPPMILAGSGAEKYAVETGVELMESAEEMISNKALKTYRHYKSSIEKYETENNIKLSPLDTVGAVVVDSNGNIAVGCSSGGLILKVSGRVGQASTYGAGCWAEKTDTTSIATCTTGNGEYLMKTLLAREIVADLKNAECHISSLSNTFRKKFLDSPFLNGLQEVYGGALTLVYDPTAKEGDLLWGHTTKFMCIGHMSSEDAKPKYLLSDMPTTSSPGKVTNISGYHFKF